MTWKSLPILFISTVILFILFKLSEISYLYISLPSLQHFHAFSKTKQNGNIYQLQDSRSMRKITKQINDERKGLIPPVIHQIWKTSNLTEYPGYNSNRLWKKLYHNHQRGFQVKLWTFSDILHLIQANYSLLLPEYLSLPYDIQRADIARYLILYHEGGFYADLDTFPSGGLLLSEIRSFNLVIPYSTDSVTLASHFLGAQPRNGFLFHLLTHFNQEKEIWSQYFHVLTSTGPFYLHKEFYSYFKKNLHENEAVHVLLLRPILSKKFFHHIGGRSWLQLDGIVFNYIGDHFLWFVSLSGISLGVACWMYITTRESKNEAIQKLV